MAQQVVRAYPCRRALGSQSGTSVELDPSAEVETRALMSAEDLIPCRLVVPLLPLAPYSAGLMAFDGQKKGFGMAVCTSAHDLEFLGCQNCTLGDGHTRVEPRAACSHQCRGHSTRASAQAVSAGITHTRYLRHSRLRRTVRISATTRRSSAVAPQGWSHSWEPSLGPMICTCPPL